MAFSRIVCGALPLAVTLWGAQAQAAIGITVEYDRVIDEISPVEQREVSHERTTFILEAGGIINSDQKGEIKHGFHEESQHTSRSGRKYSVSYAIEFNKITRVQKYPGYDLTKTVISDGNNRCVARVDYTKIAGEKYFKTGGYAGQPVRYLTHMRAASVTCVMEKISGR